MKRIISALFLVLLLSSVTFTWCGVFPRHVDPDLVPAGNPDPYQLIEMYSSLFGYLSDSNYEAAASIIDTVDDLYASPEAKESLLAYNELLRTLIWEINQTDLSVSEAFNELYWLRETKAYAALLRAYPHISRANVTTLELLSESSILADVLGGDPEKYVNETGRAEELVDYLDLLIQQVVVEVERITQLKLAGLLESSLFVETDNLRPFVGEEIVVSGILSAGDVLLDGKIVEISIDKSSVSAITGMDGSYNVSVVVPYLYKESILVTVSYFPDVDDQLFYTPVRSGIWLEPVYYPPALRFNYPPSVFPGKEYGVNGKISIGDQPIENVVIIIEGFGSIDSTASDRIGAFFSSITIPEDVEAGTKTIYVSSRGAGLTGPFFGSYEVQVEKLKIELDSTNPWFLLSGSDLSISGSISSTGAPLANCRVIVEFGNQVYFEETDTQGNFEFSLPVGMLTLSTYRHLTMTAMPNEPWIETAVAESSVLVFNALFTFPMALLVGILIYRNLSRTESLTDSPILEEIPEPMPFVYHHVSGLSGFYLRAVQIVHRISGVGLQPSNTIREYLSMVKPRISRRIFRLFNQISRLFERWIYERKRGRPPLKTTERLLKSLEDEEDLS